MQEMQDAIECLGFGVPYFKAFLKEPLPRNSLSFFRGYLKAQVLRCYRGFRVLVLRVWGGSEGCYRVYRVLEFRIQVFG